MDKNDTVSEFSPSDQSSDPLCLVAIQEATSQKDNSRAISKRVHSQQE